MKAILRIKLFLLASLLAFASGSAWATTVTYSITGTQAASVSSGTAPSGASVSYTQTYGTAKQNTGGNSATMTLTGYAGYKITAIRLYTKSNKNAGAGSFLVKAGDTELMSITAGAYNTKWSTSYTQTYEWITPTMTNNAYAIGQNENVVLTLSATTSSLYWEKVELTYEEAQDKTPHGLAFPSDSYEVTEISFTAPTLTNPNNLPVSYASSNTAVATVDAATGAVTVVGYGKTEISAAFAGDDTYEAGSASYTLKVKDPNVEQIILDFEGDNWSDGWTVTNFTRTTSANHTQGGTRGGSTGGKTSGTLEYTSEITGVTHISYWISKNSSNTSSGYYYTLYASSNKSTWTEIQKSKDLSTCTQGVWSEESIEITDWDEKGYKYLKLEFSGGTAVRLIDDIVITYTPAAPVAVTGVTLDKASATLLVGATETLTATVAPADATNKNVAWSTSDASVATVANGVVTAVGEGSATITATTEDGEMTATCTVTVNLPAGTGSGTETDPYDITRAKALIDNNLIPAGNVHVKGWISSIASTSVSSGKLNYYISSTKGGEDEFEFYKGKNMGDTNFTDVSNIAVGDFVIGLGKLTKHGETYEFADGNYLVKHVTTPSFSIANLVVSRGDEISPVITTSNTEMYEVTYTSGDPSVVSVSADGKSLSAVGFGETTITTTMGATANFYAATTTFTVTVKPGLIGIEVSGDITQKEYYYGDNFNYAGLVVTATYEDESEVDVTEFVTWTSAFDQPLTTLGKNKDMDIEAEFNGETTETKVTFTVLDNLTGITLNTDNVKKVYALGEEFSKEGLVVTAHYLSGDLSSEDVDMDDVLSYTGYDKTTPGTQTITVTYNDAPFAPQTATYTITVKDPNVTDISAVTASGLSATGSGVLTWTVDSFTFTANKASGSTNPIYSKNGDVRVYANGTFTIETTDYAMTQIVFNLSTQGKKRLAPITANNGTITAQASGDETVTWTGFAKSVTFTVGGKANYGSDGSSNAGQLCFSSIQIETPQPKAVSVGKTGFSTWYDSQRSLTVPEGVDAYTFVEGAGNALQAVKSFSAGEVIPKDVAVVLFSKEAKEAEKQYAFLVAANETYDNSANLLKGTDEPELVTVTSTSNMLYKLANGKEGVGFYQASADGASFMNGAHKAYLEIPSAMATRPFVFGDNFGEEVTSLMQQLIEQSADGAFDLQGRRVAKPSHGLYIVNGKKMFIK